MRKWMKLTVSLVVLTVLLLGCGGKSAENIDAAPQKEAALASDEGSSAEDISATIKIYTDKAGRDVEVPVRPERIITVNMTAEAIALGVKPIGAADNWLVNLSDSQKEGIESVGAVKALNFEKILELEPELIITPMNVTDEEAIASLSKIAPTVVGPFFGDALENIRTIGDLLDRSEEAEAWISAYQARSKETKEKLADVIVEGSSALVVQLSSKDNTYIYPSSTWPVVYDVLGLTLPDAAELKTLTAAASLSLEQLTEYDPEYIFLTTSGSDAGMDELVQNYTDNAVWKGLSAVKNNHVYIMGSRLSSGDVLALDWALDEVVRAVEEVKN